MINRIVVGADLNLFLNWRSSDGRTFLDLLRHHREADERVRTEGRDHGDVGKFDRDVVAIANEPA